MKQIEHLARDLAHGMRTLVRMPLVTTVVVLSLAVGIGVNTTIFSWIQLLVFKPLPGVSDGSRFYLVEPRAETNTYPGASWPEYRDLREQLRSLPDLLAFRMVPVNLGDANRVERIYGLLVSGNYFPALGLQPAAGRFITPDEVTRPGGEPVVVVSHAFWQTRLAGRGDAIGQTVRLNDRDLTVVGVTPEGFQGTVTGMQFDVWVPATMAPTVLAGSRELDERGLRGYSIMGRLAPGATVAGARFELEAAMRELARLHPDTNRTMRAELLPFWQTPRGPRAFLLQGLLILQGVMVLLLLAVCSNTANLLLARAASRQREVAVRLAVGSGPWGILRLLLVENLMLGLLGAAFGVLLAMWGTTALRAVPLSIEFPIRFQTSVDATGLGVAILLGLGCAAAFGLAPALQLMRIEPQRALGAGSQTAPRARIRNLVMGVQVAFALAVLVVAGLFVGSFQEARGLDPGFRREGVLLAAYDLGGRGLDDSYARDFARRLLERLSSMRATESVAIASNVPLDIHGLPLTSFSVEGRARTDGGTDRALMNTVTADYFRVMGIPLVDGPGFVDLSDTAASPQVVVNEEFVRRFIGDGEILGRRVESRGRTYAIAGIVRNSTYEAFGEAPIPALYFSYRDRTPMRGEIHLRARSGAESMLAPEVRRIVSELDPTLPVFNVRTLGEHVETNLFLRRIPARMFVVLGPLLLVLAAIGIYAVVAYSVAHRTTEIGVRLALGATAAAVVGQVVRESLRFITAGALSGWLVVFIVYSHLGGGHGASGTTGRAIEAAAFAGIPALLLAIATIACWIPARRATKIDPVIALRQQ